MAKTDFVNIHRRKCEYFTDKSFHPSILALQDGTRGPAPLSDIPYWVVEARELAGTIIVHPMFINSFDALRGHPCPLVGGKGRGASATAG
jgi:hypothetical protein